VRAEATSPARAANVHELSIAQSLIDAIRAELVPRGNPRLARVGLRIGDLAGVQTDALRFSFEAIVKDTPFEQAELEVERVPLTYRCRGCAHEFAVERFEVRCPACGGADTVAVKGDELELSYLEVE
jgi:hydrogenase nickel incorporation protein HypA/HybF